jgi:hypothetical protein
MDIETIMELPNRTANFAFADALLVLKEHGLDYEVDSLTERWSDVYVPFQAGITKGVTMSDNPDENFTNSFINVLTLPFRIIAWPFKKFMSWAYKGVGE